MSRIISPTITSDNGAYNGIRDLAAITATNSEIDANPLFEAAENFIADKLPDAELRSPTETGKGRTYPKRASVISALKFLTAAYMLRGGGDVAGKTIREGSGELKSETETIGPVTRTKSYDVRQGGGIDIDGEERANWLEKQALSILKGLGADVSDSTALGSVYVGTTKSRLP